MTAVYTNKLAQSLNELRKENQLCDVVITVSGRDFNAHKNVLAARSSYFLAMFTSGFKETSESKVNIDGKPEIFETILDYVYTGTMKITGEIACELLEMACYMQLTDVSQYIANFIQCKCISLWSSGKIPVENIYKISEIASCHDHLKDLAVASEQQLCKSYKQLKSSDAFLQLASIDFLKKFLAHSDLSKKDEEKEVLELVVKWLKYDFENRREFAASLLSNVRLGLVPEECRTELLSEDILGIPECKQIVDSVKSHQQSGLPVYKLAQKYPSLFTTRSTISAKVSAVSQSFGSGGSGTNSFEYFDVKHKLWTDIPSIPTLSWVPSLIVIHGKLYAIGGKEKTWTDFRRDRFRGCAYDDFDMSRWRRNHFRGCAYDDSDMSESDLSDQGEYAVSYRNDCRSYDPEGNCWRRCPAMKYARANPRLVYLNKCIYTIGGSGDYGEMKIVECYEMAEKKWKDVASLPDKFHPTSAVAFQDSILVYGRYTEHEDQYARSTTWEILVYNPSVKDAWLSKFKESDQRKDFYVPVSKPLIFLHKGQCYRVAFHRDSGKIRAVVNQLTVRSSRSVKVSSIGLGEEVSQSPIPPTELGGFCIGDVLLFPLDGVIQTIGTIKKEPATDEYGIVFRAWEGIKADFGLEQERSNTVTFMCDMKKK